MLSNNSIFSINSDLHQLLHSCVEGPSWSTNILLLLHHSWCTQRYMFKFSVQQNMKSAFRTFVHSYFATSNKFMSKLLAGSIQAGLDWLWSTDGWPHSISCRLQELTKIQPFQCSFRTLSVLLHPYFRIPLFLLLMLKIKTCSTQLQYKSSVKTEIS